MSSLSDGHSIRCCVLLVPFLVSTELPPYLFCSLLFPGEEERTRQQYHQSSVMSPKFRLSPLTPLIFFLCFCLLVLAGGARGQVETKTDPSEVSALNAIFHDWKISSSDSKIQWNTSGDPCSDAANDTTSLDSFQFNPGIKCNCSFNNGTLCHITELKVAQKISYETRIIEDLKNLTKLSRLLLQGNNFSGSLPPFVGNMTALQHLNLSSNTLAGTIPRELGNLKNLITLDMSINKLNGSLPVELGKLTNLQKLCLSSNALHGQIPSTFSDLVNLQTLWISDNNFSGKIPDFVGSFPELLDLRMQGNFLEGPIPSFSNLTKLTRLQIGEMVNGSSSLAFIKDMKSLNILIVRNSKISVSLPSDFGNYTNLEHLDLSFNNLTGPIPDSLFSLSSLEYLFLGNNSLSGALPLQKSKKLLNIDLSYNHLSGTFPSWVNEPDLNINLVANDFKMDPNNSTFRGLRCLQNGIRCHDSPTYYRFAINCGSSRSVKSSGGLEYEIDEETLKAASYFVSTDNKWAVSSVGRFLDVARLSYVMSTSSRFTGTSNSELFQKARLSPSSLRYYGLGLRNGNYTVKLSFGETLNWNVYKGRRLFDIFIQGIRIEKDFDITKTAGGENLAALERNYRASVTSNFLEIHLFWAGRGTCCVPTYGSYGPSLSAVSVTAADNSKTEAMTSSKKSNTPVIVGITVALSVLLLCLVGIFTWKRKRELDISEDEELHGLVIRPNMFSYSELRNATNNFKSDNELGKGGFGPVYKGTLLDGKEVAVKQLAISSVQGKRQFITEVATVSAVQHRNLVRLYGCCCEGNNRLLVYEYMANRSLDQALFGPLKVHMDWSSRFRICLNTARGLAYLHEESSIRIVHRDVKASNILLDASLNPKISDFGLAKHYDEQKSHISTGVAGTVGYLAPEYAMRGQLTVKADVFAFGVVALEILSGKRNTEPSMGEDKIYLLDWAWHLHEEKRDLEMVDPNLSSYNEVEALRMIGVAFMCTHASPSRRPTMSKVVATLVGDTEVEEIVTKPSYLMEWENSELSAGFSATSAPHSTEASFPLGTLETKPLQAMNKGR